MTKSIRSKGRKLISITGYEGFKSQLRFGECLVLQYGGGHSPKEPTTLRIIVSEHDFDEIVYSIEPDEILGFWAVPRHRTDGKIDRDLIEPEPDFDDRSSVRRPVEDLVLGIILRNGNLDAWLYQQYGDLHDRKRKPSRSLPRDVERKL